MLPPPLAFARPTVLLLVLLVGGLVLLVLWYRGLRATLVGESQQLEKENRLLYEQLKSAEKDAGTLRDQMAQADGSGELDRLKQRLGDAEKLQADARERMHALESALEHSRADVQRLQAQLDARQHAPAPDDELERVRRHAEEKVRRLEEEYQKGISDLRNASHT